MMIDGEFFPDLMFLTYEIRFARDVFIPRFAMIKNVSPNFESLIYNYSSKDSLLQDIHIFDKLNMTSIPKVIFKVKFFQFHRKLEYGNSSGRY